MRAAVHARSEKIEAVIRRLYQWMKKMMKAIYRIFIVLVFTLCLIPFAGMAVRPTTQSTENRSLSAFPSLKEVEGGINLSFFSEFDTWFNEHFAFRNELVYADARIQTGLFGTSPSESVIAGTDGWLYYASTLSDYQGTKPLSDRELYCIARNLSLAADYTKSRGAAFVLCVPPNKNTLYGERMPYYDALVAEPEHNLSRLLPYLEELAVPYADLEAAFSARDEVLYLARDSHWNNKGALLAYNTILDRLGTPHDRYEDAAAQRRMDEDGDLNRMVYTLYGEREMNIYYDIPQIYETAADFESVEDLWVETSGPQKNGTLLMFRDSFGNTLLPLFANQFETGCFTKEGLYRLEQQLDVTEADTVVFEKVERNLTHFLTMPPLFDAQAKEPAAASGVAEGAVSLSAAPFSGDRTYLALSGTVTSEAVLEKTDLYVRINGTAYPALMTGEGELTVYFREETAPDFPWEIAVLAETEGETVQIGALQTVDREP